MKLKHIVMWCFKEEAEGHTKAENMAWVKEHLEALVGAVPSLLSMEVGMDALPGKMHYDMALISTFENADGLRAYKEDPRHVKISEYVSKVRTERATVDFYFED